MKDSPLSISHLSRELQNYKGLCCRVQIKWVLGTQPEDFTLWLQAFLSYLPRLWISFSVQQVYSMIQRTFGPIIYSLD